MTTTVQARRSKREARTPAAALASLSLKDDCLVGTVQAAQLLGIAAKTLREWRSQRTGPAALKIGSGRNGRVFYRRSSLEAWIRANVTSVTGGEA